MMRFSLMMLLLGSLVPQAQAQGSVDEPEVLSGRVMTSAGDPLDRAWVIAVDDASELDRGMLPRLVRLDRAQPWAVKRLEGRSALTGEDGRFEGLARARQLVVWRPGFTPLVAPSSEALPEHDLVLHRGRNLEVILSDTSLPRLVNLKLSLWYDGGSPLIPRLQEFEFPHRSAAEQRTRTFSGLIPGPYRVVLGSGRIWLSRPLTIRHGDDRSRRLDLTPSDRSWLELELQGDPLAFDRLVLAPGGAPTDEYATCWRYTAKQWRALCWWSGPTVLLGTRRGGPAGLYRRSPDMEVLARFVVPDGGRDVTVAMGGRSLTVTVPGDLADGPMSLMLTDIAADRQLAGMDIDPGQSISIPHLRASFYRLDLIDRSPAGLAGQATTWLPHDADETVTLAPISSAQGILRVQVVDEWGVPVPRADVGLSVGFRAPLAEGVTSDGGHVDLVLPLGVEGVGVWATQDDFAGLVRESIPPLNGDGTVRVVLKR